MMGLEIPVGYGSDGLPLVDARPCDIDAEANRVITLPTPPYDPYPWQLLDNAWRIIRHVRGEAAEQAAYNRLLEKRISDLEVALAGATPDKEDQQAADLLWAAQNEADK